MLARGTEQIRWLSNMLTDGQPSVTRELRGRAKQYSRRYMASFSNLCSRMTHAGYTVTRTPGPRGGEWGSVYTARKGA